MANKQRGEFTVTILTKKYTIRPTFNALQEIEDRLGMSISKLIDRISGGDVRLRDITTVVWCGMVGFYGRDAMEYEEVGEKIFENGLLDIVRNNEIAEFLMKGILGNKTLEEVEKDQGKSEKQPEKN